MSLTSKNDQNQNNGTEKSAIPQTEGKSNQEELSLEKQLENCIKLRDEYLAGWQRARADFINYQKDEQERFRHAVRFANTELIVDLLPVLDSFDSAIANAGTETEKSSCLLIKSQLMGILKKAGLEEIKAEPGDEFDPAFHEAVETVSSENQKSNVILEVVNKGYTLFGKVIRATRVKVVK